MTDWTTTRCLACHGGRHVGAERGDLRLCAVRKSISADGGAVAHGGTAAPRRGVTASRPAGEDRVRGSALGAGAGWARFGRGDRHGHLLDACIAQRRAGDGGTARLVRGTGRVDVELASRPRAGRGFPPADPRPLYPARRPRLLAGRPTGSCGAGIRGALATKYDEAKAAEPITIELLYGDQEGGQRAISRFSLFPHETDGQQVWLASVSRHWHLDRKAPR